MPHSSVGDVPASVHELSAETPSRVDDFMRRHARALVAGAIFAGSVTYYGLCLYPGVGGIINPGDSAKFQVLTYAPIMVHGPGYPLYLILAGILRALELPWPGWWQASFLLSAVPGAFANAMAFLLVERAVGSIRFGVVAALLMGSAQLMAVQATETEVYALNIAFVLTVVYFLMRFLETDRLSDFLIASAAYALSFGIHVSMIMLLPLFLGVTVLRHRLVLRPRPILLASLFVLLGASQYLFLAYVAHDPATKWSEYMPLPPSATELLKYIAGVWFSDLYGTGLESPRNLHALGMTFQNAHPWLSAPLIGLGLLAFIASILGRRDAGWRKAAVLYAAALCYLPFVLWYGAGDIEAFHLPILALTLLAAVASLGCWARRRPGLFAGGALALILFGLYRAGDVGIGLAAREPGYAGLVPYLREIVEQVPGESGPPVIAMSYDLRMASMYHQFAGDLPERVDYRLAWRLPDDPPPGGALVGAGIPAHDAVWMTGRLEQRNPDLRCEIRKLNLSRKFRWPAFGFRCVNEERERQGRPRRPLGS